MLTFTFRTKGSQALRDALAARNAAVRKAARRYLREEGEAIMTASKMIVPVDTGTLRRSGFASQVTESGSAMTVTLGYGGLAQGYAVVQHESLFFRHTKGQSAKFLEIPAEKAMQTFGARFAAKMKPILEKS